MSDFDHLIEDAENFQDEEDVDDDFVTEYNNEVNSKKRASVDVESVAVKKAKPPGYLADYFVDNPVSSVPKPNDSVKGNFSQSTDNRSNEGNSQPAEPASEQGPNCMCGIGSVSKTTLKEGPNKNRMFWICSQPRESQCKFFEWCDETKKNLTTSESLQGIPHQQKPQQSSQTTLTGPLCKCNLASIQRTTMKEGPNHGRNFWVCPASRESQCKFFEWENADPNGNDSSYGNNSGNVNSSNYGTANSTSNSGSFGNSGGGGGGTSKGSCYRCKKEGHWSSNCPELQAGGGGGGGGGGNYGSYGNKQSSGGGGSQATGSCFKCGEAGHWSSKCPKAGGGSKRY